MNNKTFHALELRIMRSEPFSYVLPSIPPEFPESDNYIWLKGNRVGEGMHSPPFLALLFFSPSPLKKEARPAMFPLILFHSMFLCWLGPPVVPFYPFLGQGSSTKID